MNRTKIVLLALIIFHLISSIRFNILGLTALKLNNEENKINSFGKLFIGENGKKLEKNLTILPLQATNLYGVYTGTNRGYSFFSPNVSSVTACLSFYNGKQKLEIPIKNVETKSKLLVMTYFLLLHLESEEIRNQIVLPTASRLFTQHPELSKIEAFIEYEKMPSLKNKKEPSLYKNIKAFTIINPTHE
ncbi:MULTISPECIES: hypothetical protein [Sphingobacterium]|uniref:Uncharacterized protein n=1 Tax=Sphingobacterium populi TaxID=1812824 RepID=A0ABW5UAE5_9SPHI|nr:hypothetical protein [Sphingobacterium sp. CFCC 11742]